MKPACFAGLLALGLLTGISLARAGDRPLVINAGRGGDTTADLLARVEGDVLVSRPEVVVLLVGTNDTLNSQKALPLAVYRKNLAALTRRIAQSGAKVLMVTIPPAHAPYLLQRHPAEFYGPGGPDARINAANEVIREVAAESGSPLVNFFAAVAQAGGASAQPGSLIRNAANSASEDGVHPTAEGYRLLAHLVAESIRHENLAGARRIVCFGDSITFGVHLPGAGTATGETYPAFLAQALHEGSKTSAAPPRR